MGGGGVIKYSSLNGLPSMRLGWSLFPLCLAGRKRYGSDWAKVIFFLHFRTLLEDFYTVRLKIRVYSRVQ
jgi:hypothetical protein